MNTLNPPALTGGGRMRGPAPDVASRGLPRSFVIGSIVLHVLMFLFAVGLPRLLSSGPSGNKVYVVDLVSLPGGNPAPAAPAPPAAASPAPEAPKPAPVKPPEAKKPEVKPDPPKKQPKPIVLPDKDAAKKTTKTPVKPPEKKPVEPEPKAEPKETASTEASGSEETAAAAPVTPNPPLPETKPGTAPPGAPGGTGTGPGGSEGSGTGGGDELDFYLSMLKRRIETAWKRPVSTSREIQSATVFIELSPTGRLIRLEMKTPSGYAPFDRSIIQAVRDAEPFPPFPLALKMDKLARSITFQLTPQEGGAPQ